MLNASLWYERRGLASSFSSKNVDMVIKQIGFTNYYWFDPKTLNYLAFKSFDFERTWWRLFQKRIVYTKFDIYVFINATFVWSFLVQSNCRFIVLFGDSNLHRSVWESRGSTWNTYAGIHTDVERRWEARFHNLKFNSTILYKRRQ